MIPVCPKCDLALIVMIYDDVEADYCARCCGIWLDHGELDIMCDRVGLGDCDPMSAFVDPVENASASRSDRPCPRCDDPMCEVAGKLGESEIFLDQCDNGHGIWFDAGELRLLMTHLADGDKHSVILAELDRILGGPPVVDSNGSGAPA